jgi:indolepyruvate ferredoxin oxidoreductase, alpha subunit
MGERFFAKEVGHLGLGTGEEFRGEGILAIAKALPQSGVGYVGGYQGAPILQPMDALADAQDILADLGERFTVSTSAAAAKLSASLMDPIQRAATFGSAVGTDVAADALAPLASGVVVARALIIEALKGARAQA